MKKNGQYVGVDEKFIPEEEKYVDNTLNDEIKGVIKDGVKSVKDYVGEEENKEKIKKGAKKGLKIAKGIGIGYLALIVFIILTVITIFIVTFVLIFKASHQNDAVFNTVNDIIDDTKNSVNNKGSDIINSIIDESTSNYEVSSFNQDLEKYQGTQRGMQVIKLLDNVVTKMKKYSEHSLVLVFNENTLTNTTDIIAIKKELEDWSDYEVEFDYGTDGFINKITITKY